MKKLILLITILFSLCANAQFDNPNTPLPGQTHQQQKEQKSVGLTIDTETNTSKFAQGFLVGGLLYFSSNSLNKEQDKWVSRAISLLGSVAVEAIFNKKTNFEKMAFVGLGTVSVNVTFNILE